MIGACVSDPYLIGPERFDGQEQEMMRIWTERVMLLGI